MAAIETIPEADAIRAWMVCHADGHRDPRTGEVNMTSIVEAWDAACADGGATLDPDHPAWEVATEFVS